MASHGPLAFMQMVQVVNTIGVMLAEVDPGSEGSPARIGVTITYVERA